ncbi:hypothetical protein [Micromonospora chersina]|uniref:hypothetical protein n=1 Tax=Micromonospora chersina TaxID=47854 RepID=UPI0033F62B01
MAGGSSTAGTRSARSRATGNGGGGRSRPEGPPFRKPAWPRAYSFESDDRMEAKLDALLRERGLDPDNP